MSENKGVPFCQAAWTTVQYSGTYGGGGISPCCEWSGEKYTGSIKDYQNSDYLNSIKEAMNNYDMTVINKTCQECIKTESLNQLSARNYIQRYVKNGRYKIDALNKLDYRPDNLCNLKCRMCSIYSSSLIEEEYVAHGMATPIIQRPTDDVIDFDLSNLDCLAILGGEPTVNKRMFPILDYLIDNNMQETVTLNYTTNCTSVNRPWMSRVEKFKQVHINLSIDAAGKAYEYIRTGANWKKVEQNIPKIINLTTDKEDYKIQMVVQFHSFAIIEDWIEYFFQFPPNTINMTPLQGKMHGSINCIPDYIKAQKVDYLKKLNHPIAEQAIKYFESSKYDSQEIKGYQQGNGFLDSIRSTNILDLDPIFEEILSYKAS
jgi:molybdenum cofactor biosynthesis enzyme MoaA